MKLAYTATNVPLRAYMESLNGLRVALDGVERSGAKECEGVVKRVEKELDEVDGMQRRVWEAQRAQWSKAGKNCLGEDASRWEAGGRGACDGGYGGGCG